MGATSTAYAVGESAGCDASATAGSEACIKWSLSSISQFNIEGARRKSDEFWPRDKRVGLVWVIIGPGNIRKSYSRKTAYESHQSLWFFGGGEGDRSDAGEVATTRDSFAAQDSSIRRCHFIPFFGGAYLFNKVWGILVISVKGCYFLNRPPHPLYVTVDPKESPVHC